MNLHRAKQQRSMMNALSAQNRFYKPDVRVRKSPDLEDFEHAVRANRSTHVQGWYQSWLNAASFPFFSGLELKSMKLLDLSENVKSYKAQPQSIQYWMNGSPASYTADALVHPYQGGSFYVEVKPREQLRDPAIANKLVAIGTELKLRGISLRIVTDEFLATEPRNSNIRALQLFRPVEPDIELAYLFDTHLAQSQAATIGALSRLASNVAFGRETVHALILRRHLATNLHSALNDDSIVHHNRYQHL
jgi:hypothetical protein